MNVLSGQPLEIHQKIDDKWLADNASDKNAVWNCFNKDRPHDTLAKDRVIRPRGIMIKSSSVNPDTATYATVRGFLWGENTKDTDDYDLAFDSPYPLAFKRIYAQGTTARGIQIFG